MLDLANYQLALFVTLAFVVGIALANIVAKLILLYLHVRYKKKS
jgi:uncharacterized membrane protein YciS (DUF1049 family)